MNPAAEHLLNAQDGLKVAAGKLEASYSADNRALLAAIRKSVTRPDKGGSAINDALSVSRPSGKVSLGLVVQSIPVLDWSGGEEQPSAIVFVRDADSKTQASNRMIQQLFNLTLAETNLAVELVNGASLEEAAEALGIRRNTARAHLRAIFSKTGVRRQTELVRIILNSVGALGQAPGRGG
jgi:DNA-binding CsgD family transcriptional regulator